MHGVEPISNPRPPANERDSRMTKDCWYEEASHSVENAIDSARNNAHEYREKMKKTYDRGKEQTDVTTGDRVYLRNDAKADGLDPRYNGPFTVIHTSNPNVTIDVGGGKTKVVHLNRCKVAKHHADSFVSAHGNASEGTHSPQVPTSNSRELNESIHAEELQPTDAIPVTPNLGQEENYQVTRSGRISQKPLRYRETLTTRPSRRGSDVRSHYD